MCSTYYVDIRISPNQECYGTHVDEAIASSLWPDQAAAPARAFASEDTFPSILLSTVGPKQPANLTTRDTNITGRHICVSTNVLVQLAHECNAELADFIIRLALGVKIGATFAAAHIHYSQSVDTPPSDH